MPQRLFYAGLELDTFRSFLVPGDEVTHPQHPEWGIGIVQSARAERVTVNFENNGKILIDASRVSLIPV